MNIKLIATSQWCNEKTIFTYEFELDKYDPSKPSTTMKDIFIYWHKLADMKIRLNLFDMILKISAASSSQSDKVAKRVVNKLNKMSINLQELDNLSYADIKRIIKKEGIK